jgi:anti-sigma factor RsiW
MGSLSIHDLTAAYALDALDADEAREYESHLAHCDRCRSELAAFSSTAVLLAHAAETPAPPSHLRERILVAARAERSNVVPLRRRRTLAVTAAAIAAAAAAVALGIWAASLSRSLDSERSARARADHVLALVADPAAQHIALQGRAGSLVVGPSGEAALVITRLQHAPGGKTYEAWVIQKGRPQRAGTFGGGGATIVLPLQRSVPSGAIVAVTVERRGGVDAPTTQPILSAKAV